MRRAIRAGLRGRHRCPDTGGLGHRSGRFFAVRGPGWRRPAVRRPETGIAGLTAREVDAVPHSPPRAKGRPGNVDGVRLPPTEQVTKGNRRRVRGGSSAPA
ncbi:NDP-hexose 23-dehydratase [Streptomyces zinciresistens K42]|uniref:NDP-hexose 23-dehydratase n=1 Tax=Streptomyces zinciresistens K42 TaxID=700597 RepID=G2G4Q3_9ACTN|nr:NDP-hexose 23-dehydratase [Streptomyces zinciresistens K42]